MPAIVSAASAHYEGEDIRTLGRIVGLDQVMLNPDGAGALTITILSKGKTVYTKLLTSDSNGILDAPEQPDEWDLDGLINFDFTHEAAALAAESPSFAFQGGRSYTIVYSFASELSGAVVGHHRVRILGSP